MSDWGWEPIDAPSPANGWSTSGYRGTGSLEGRATITKKTGKRGNTTGFTLNIDGKEFSLPKKGSFDHADAAVKQHLSGGGGGGAVQSGPRGGRYIEGPGGSKQYVKSLGGTPMNPYNLSIPPLNWQQPKIEEHTNKSLPSSDSHVRAGTPPTIRGAFHGHVPALRPSLSGPDLFLETPMAKSQGAPGQDFHDARKQALDGIFAKAMGLPQVPLQKPQQPMMGQPPQAGQQGMAPGMQPGAPQGGGAPKVPGFNQMAPDPQAMQAMPGQQQPMGMTPQGQPIFADPFNPAHQQFAMPEHQQAAMMHQQAGMQAPPKEAQQHQQAAEAHNELGKDSQSPMERASEKYGQGENPPMEGQGKPPAPPQAKEPGKDMQNNPAAPGHAMMGAQPPTPGQLAAPKPPPPAATMQSHPGQPPMGTPQGQPPMGQQGAHGGPAEHPDQGKPQAPPQPDGMPRQGPKPGMSEQSAGGAEGKPSVDKIMQHPQVAADPELQGMLQQFLQSMEAPKGPTPGSSSNQEPKGMPKPMKQTGPSSPPTNAGSQTTDIEPTAQKSLASLVRW